MPARWTWLTTPATGSLYLRDGRDEAAVDLLYSTGGTANWHYLYVYSQAGSAPKLLGVLRSVAIERSLLILDFADTRKRIADCCSEGEVRVRYRWTGSRFVAAR